MPPRSRLLLVLTLALGRLGLSPARAEGPADPLLKLVPADAAVTIAVEDLRGHAREFAGAPLADGLGKLPALRDWLASDRSRGLRMARKKAETTLGVDLPTLRDGLFGEAVVLVLRLPKGGQPQDARGLFLIRVPDRALLDRMVAGQNAAQLKSGELTRVVDREYGGTTYSVREFRAARRPTESYARLDDRIFAWSNSEELIRGAIDLQSRGSGSLADLADFRRVRGRLPGRAVASLYVDPRFVERLISAGPKPPKSGDDKVMTLLTRYLAAVRYAGVALQWRDGLVLHSEEVINSDALPPAWKRWAARASAPDPRSTRIPASALLMATADLDFGVLIDTLADLASDADAAKIENLRLTLNGLLLGLDARAEVVPRLGPGTLFYLEPPDAKGPAGRLPAVVSIEVSQGEGAAKTVSAIDNALRTMLAIHALDDTHGGGKLRVESRSVAGAIVTSLNRSTPFAYAVREGRLILGTTAEAVARALAAIDDRDAANRVERVRSAYFPDSVSFALADLRKIHEIADAHRSDLAHAFADHQHRPETEAAHDLDQALALIDLFDAAFLTTTVAADFSGVGHKLGLVRVGR